MENVAQAAGVSRRTVSRALRDDGSVSPATRDRILKIVRKMNYTPDLSAGTLSTKRSGFVATLVPSLNNLHFAESVQALDVELEALDRPCCWCRCSDYGITSFVSIDQPGWQLDQRDLQRTR